MAGIKVVPPGTMGRGLTPTNLPLPPKPGEAHFFPGGIPQVNPVLLGYDMASEARDPDPDMSLLGAAAYMDNAVLGVIDIFSRDTYKEDPTHNPAEFLKRFTVSYGTVEVPYYIYNHLDRFVGSRSEEETRDIMARIDREEIANRRLGEGGTFGIFARMAAGSMDPLALLPMRGWLGGLQATSRIGIKAKGAAEGAIGGGIATGVHEGIMQTAQETRTGAESAFAVVAGVAVGAAVGSFASVGTRAP